MSNDADTERPAPTRPSFLHRTMHWAQSHANTLFLAGVVAFIGVAQWPMIKGILLVVMIVAGSCLAQTQLLQNPSFEQGGSSSDLAAGWNRWGQWMNREEGWKPTHSGACLIGYHHWQIENRDDSGLWQDAKVQPGRKYTFSIFVTRDVAENPARQVEVALESTVDGRQVTIAKKSYPVSDLASGEKWSRLVISGVATGDTMRVLVRIAPAEKGARGGAIKMDDASLIAAE